ncbi:MAG TPA: tetratricopeptide repeat protein [Paludibacter sp.]|nr:tetratricopeptide repeat protein [Paludibacter sp.]
MNTRFNVYFNGNVSYNDGLKNIQKANVEDYSGVIPMYPISRHSNATAATSNMDRAIEKCRKAIKLHSIKVKPQKNYKKASSSEYKLFYDQEEFNPAMKDAWVLLGKAEFHKAEFLGSVGTFSYIIRHYGKTDKDMEVTCQLWVARAYGEMGWMYEAEEVLSKIQQNNLKHSNIGLFASVNADLLLKKHQYKEAIPFLQLALLRETDKYSQQRFSYLLAQLYQKADNKKAAYDFYSKVIKSNPPYEMNFNAKISRAQLDQGNVSIVRKELIEMSKNKNNKDYLDQLYFALGNTYLQRGDTAKAIENYKLSTEKSTRKGLAKASTLITLGDIYYKKKKYVSAQPCYEEAGKIITNENEDYARVTRLGEMLNELVAQNDIVVLQDSLQRLAAMPESKRIDAVNNVINKLIATEKDAVAKELKDKQNAIAEAESESDFMSQGPIGMNTARNNIPGVAGDWYFYNDNVMRSGKAEFIKKWGLRKLEDNWRRENKATSLFAEESITQPTVKNDSTDLIPKSNSKEVLDNKKPEFYLKQIPVTSAQIEKSNADIASALFAMGQIYKDKIEDIPMSISTFEEFIRRFKTDKRVVDAYFNIYLMQTKNGNQVEADLYRMKLIAEFPGSKYQKVLSQPDYSARLERMYSEQDSIYNLTYKAYNQSDYKTVYKYVAHIKQNFPLSTLMPKFLFLNALSIGKNDTEDNFKTALSDLLKTYPESDVSAMAKDILALMSQGQEARRGTSSGSLLARRDESTKAEIKEASTQQFSTERETKHRILLVSSMKKENMNRLLYNIASFNFSRFMIKDFDLVVSKLDSARSTLSVTNFESYDEAAWYLNSISTDASLTKLLTDYKVQKVIISEENYAQVKTSFSLDDYLVFQARKLGNKSAVQLVLDKNSKKEEAVPVLKESPTKTAEKTIEKQVEPMSAKSTGKLADNLGIIPMTKSEDKQVAQSIEKPTTKSVQTQSDLKKSESVLKPVATAAGQQAETPVKEMPTVAPKPKREDVPLFKGLFAYRANDPHFVAIYIVSGSMDFEKTKAAFDAYNAKNYGIMNLKVSLETTGKQQVIIIGSLSDAQVAKSYLLRMVKEKTLFDGLKGANYRNILGSQENLNTVVQKNQLKTYFEFMQEYYLK